MLFLLAHLVEFHTCILEFSGLPTMNLPHMIYNEAHVVTEQLSRVFNLSLNNACWYIQPACVGIRMRSPSCRASSCCFLNVHIDIVLKVAIANVCIKVSHSLCASNIVVALLVPLLR